MGYPPPLNPVCKREAIIELSIVRDDLPLEWLGPLYEEVVTGRFARHIDNHRTRAYAEAAGRFPRSSFWRNMAAPRTRLQSQRRRLNLEGAMHPVEKFQFVLRWYHCRRQINFSVLHWFL